MQQVVFNCWWPRWYKIDLNNIQGDMLDEGYIATDDEFQEYKVIWRSMYWMY